MPPQLLANKDDTHVYQAIDFEIGRCNTGNEGVRSIREKFLSSEEISCMSKMSMKETSADDDSKTSCSSTATPENISNDSKDVGVIQKIAMLVFPIHRHEIPIFALLSFLNFFLIVVLTLTRDLKDTLVVTNLGAESIAFLKIYGVLPAAFLQVLWYNKLSSLLNSYRLWYATAVPFFVFYVLYSIVIHPYFFDEAMDFSELSVFERILSNWTVALFYVVAELYSSVSVGILFWKLAADVVDPLQAKRFYPLFSYMSSFGPIAAGQYAVRFASTADDFQGSLNRITAAIVLSGFATCFLHRKIHKITLNDNAIPSCNSKTSRKKVKMSMSNSVRFLAENEYLRLIAILVIGYGTMFNFIEVSWKSLVKKQYSDPMEYQRFMGNFSSIVGISTFVVIFCGTNILNKLGWRIGALATPFTMAFVAVPFFLCVVFFDVESSPGALDLSVLSGTALVLLSRSFKYGLFDATTQMSYIPLDDEEKTKGKAAIDVLGSRIGKSGASFVQQGLVLVFGNILQAAPAVMVIFYAVAFLWLSSAHRLGHLYETRIGKKIS